MLGASMVQPTFAQEHRNEHFDTAHGHNHYYPARDTHFERVPVGARAFEFHGEHYWWHDGVWYRPFGGAYVVVGAPIGLYVPLLPAVATAVILGGVTYYYANETYYLYHPEMQQYEVVAPPQSVNSVASSPAMNVANNEVFVYPRNGQNAEQTARDRYECHAWAVSQTGFDPTNGQSNGRRADYVRAQGACLEGRGYTVK
jgi:hypothetical protein